MKKKLYLIAFLLIHCIYSLNGKLVTYAFDITNTKVNITGKKVTAMTINNQLPGPTIQATVGDTLQVTFNNTTDEESSIHWHGVLLPNDQDGVPYLTTPPIAPHSSFTYRYPVTHHGTYWYHSHTGLQEQRGMYGALVFHPQKKESITYNKDYVIILSDWTNEHPKKVLANLKKDGDYYALKKNTVQSWDKVLYNGKKSIKNRLRGALSRMGSMDISDIGYDAFLSNGNKEQTLQAKKGEVIRIRLINAAASTYFNVEFAQNPMTIIAADGIDVQPFQVQRLRIAIAETYDILVPIKDYKSYELRATAEDVTGKTSTFLGNGKKVLAPDIPKPNLFLTNHTTHHNNTSETHHHTKIMNNTKKIVKHMTDYDALQAISTTSFNTKLPKRTVILTLTGTMDGYIWSFNNKILSHADAISIEKGEIIRFILHNKTMMHHPLHLHGHFFRVITKQGARSPLKHTVNVPAMGTTTIEFEADANKHWFFHCHNLYHMHAGMARIISYKNSPRIHSKVFKKLAPNTWHIKSNLFMLSNMTAGMLQTSNAHNFFALEYDYNYKKEYDIELIYGKRLTMFFNLYAGGNFEQENKCKKSENTGIIGMQYLLPMFIESDLRINSKGKIRLSLSSAIQLTKRAMFNWYCDTDKEYRCILDYEINKKLSLTLAYDSDFTWGAGINIKL